jgi:hypothetical protein
MATHKVREHFYVHMDGKVHGPGTELELNEEQAERYAAQIEPVAKPEPKPRKAKADAAA